MGLWLGLGLPACTLALDPDQLNAGAEALGCASDEKVCEDPLDPERGVCVSQEDPEYGCGSEVCAPCELRHAIADCGNTQECEIVTCDPPSRYHDCNGNPSDGCEVDKLNDVDNCGSCNGRCSQNNGTPACSNGACVVLVCMYGFEDCDMNPSNLCETALAPGEVCP